MGRTTRRGQAPGRQGPPALHRLTLTGHGRSVALDLAAAQLRTLGCRAATSDSTSDTDTGTGDTGTSDTDAGQLELHRAGQDDPAVRCRIDWAGPVSLPLRTEAEVQAACGIMHVHGRRFGLPTALGVDYASAAAGMLAAQGTLAAVLARRRGMDIRDVSTSVSAAALLTVSQYLAAATAEPAGGPGSDRAAGTGGVPGGPPFVSADGVRYEIESLHAERWWRFWAALGADPVPVARGWRPFQERFGTATCVLPAELYRAAARAGFSTACDAATAADISIMAVRDRQTPALTLPPWRLGMVGAPAPAGLAPGPKRLGSPPLSGLVVVESTRRVQGPLAGHLLRLLGARLIRVEPPDGDLLRGVPPMAGDCSARFLALNRGKEVVELDLAAATGRRALRELVADADVFLHNWAPGKADEWDLHAERLCAVRPGLVYAWASGWGGVLGPAPPLGTDYLVQAHSGLAALLGPDGAPPTPSLMTLTDVLGGISCVNGVLAGLLTRAETGRGQQVDSSLLSAAALLTRLPSARRASAGPRTPVCTDLAALARDPSFALAVEHGPISYPRPPWEFG